MNRHRIDRDPLWASLAAVFSDVVPPLSARAPGMTSTARDGPDTASVTDQLQSRNQKPRLLKWRLVRLRRPFGTRATRANWQRCAPRNRDQGGSASRPSAPGTDTRLRAGP
jgi:hypothetical protein